MDITKELTEIYEKAAKRSIIEEVPEERRRLSGSMLPYCGLRDACDRLEKNDSYWTREKTMGSDFFTSVGTAAHIIFQNWLKDDASDRGWRIISNWKCKKCGIERSLVPYNKCTCGADTDFVEISVKWNNLSGNIDAVLQQIGTKRPSKNNYWIVDFKTTSKYQIEQHQRSRNVYPIRDHVWQVEAYAMMFEKQYEIEVDGWVLMYASRDNPFYSFHSEAKKLTDKRKEIIERYMNKFSRHWTIADSLGKYIDEDSIDRDTRDKIKTLVEEKPCKSLDFYQKHFHKRFSPCPVVEHCFHKNKLKTYLQNILRNAK